MAPEFMDALKLAEGLAVTPKNLQRVGEATSLEASRWAFSQWELRERAAAKFSRAREMLFTKEALEQATHERLAAVRASRFPEGELVVDLTCGIGADLIALARRGPARGFDLDPERAALARHNLRVHGLEAEVLVGDSLDHAPPRYAVVDPARRSQGRRTLDPAAFSPNPRTVAEHLETAKLAAIKLSPMLPDDVLESLGRRLEFMSFGGECREAVVWLGEEARPGRVAVHVESGSQIEAGRLPPTSEMPLDWFYDADPAAVRAHALGTLTDLHGLFAVGDAPGYLTGATAVDSVWLRGGHVLAHGAYDPSRLRRELQNMNASTPVLKQRGAGLDLQKLAQKFRCVGTRRVAVAFYTVGKGIRYVVLDAS